MSKILLISGGQIVLILIQYNKYNINTILIEFDLLRMSKILLETCTRREL